MAKRPVDITDYDRRAAARICAMVTERQARDRLVCVEIGHAISDHLERKNLPHGATDRYARAMFGKAWGTVRPYLRLFQKKAGLANADELAAKHPEWDNDHPHEPERSLRLLRWAAETREKERLVTENSRGALIENNTIETDWLTVLIGQCQVRLSGLPDQMFKVCICSPPYHGLREYGNLPGEIGHEPTADQWAARLAQDVFREVYRVLDDRGVLFIVIGDRVARGKSEGEPPNDWRKDKMPAHAGDDEPPGSLMGLPFRLARALQTSGWMWRPGVIWEKTGHTSRGQKTPQITHEQVLMFTKSMQYDFYQKAVQEPTVDRSIRPGSKGRRRGAIRQPKDAKDLGSVWRIAAHTQPHGGVAPNPLELVRRLMLYGTKEGDRVLDPFLGTGTTGMVAKMLRRRFMGIELNPEFAANAIKRIRATPDHPPARWNTPIVASEVDLLKEQLAWVTQQRDALYQVARMTAEWLQPRVDREGRSSTGQRNVL